MTDAPAASADPVAAYKAVLQRVLDNRPSGTRGRLAQALGKNRSFVSHMTSPAYATPIPAQHIETIFEICHFSPEDRRHFLDAYGEAHPRRVPALKESRRMRPHVIYLPDLGDPERNQEMDRLVGEFVQRLTKLVEG
ncbi:MAG: hypothetical protein J0H11_07495 [Rhizobiales bacterium]|nr:hypothetical protein [Hyphomicrobiales bacterium]